MGVPGAGHQHDRVDGGQQGHRVADFQRRGDVDQHAVVFLGERAKELAHLCAGEQRGRVHGGSAARQQGHGAVLARGEHRGGLEAPARLGGQRLGHGRRDNLQRFAERERPGEDLREPGRAGHAEYTCLARPAEVGLDDRHAFAGFALHQREVGDHRRAPVAGLGAEEQQRTRGPAGRRLGRRPRRRHRSRV